MTQPPNEGRLEWDYEDIDKRAWGKGEWLNEPDKVQCMKGGYPCLVVRSHHGAFCGYIGVGPSHPAYGLSSEGVPALIMDIIHADFRERLSKWGKAGMPTKKLPGMKAGLPDMGDSGMEWPKANTPVGKAVYDIRVHGGITWAGLGTDYSKAHWSDFCRNFDKARKQAAHYPIGDAARWLQKWAKAENSYEEFRRIVEQTCVCLVPLLEDHTAIWWFGFDCTHAGDLAPALEQVIKEVRKTTDAHFEGFGERKWKDVYRNLAYVENECENLATQLRAIEDANGKDKS